MSDISSLLKPSATPLRRPKDANDSQIGKIADLWWSKNRTDVYTAWIQGIQTAPRQTIMSVMVNSVPGMSLHSTPQDERFMNKLVDLFNEL